MERFKRWLEVKRVFEEALAIPAAERCAFLDRACFEDEGLRREVEALLQAPPVPTTALAALLGLPERLGDPDYGEGDMVDHFMIVRCLGRGGMGVVYEARDTRNSNRAVALKVLYSRATKLSQDKRLATLADPSIVTFHDSGETADGLPYFVFEYVAGETITTYCQRRSLGIRDRLSLFQKVCHAVAYAHQRYIIHCDLKPENILVTATGALKLLDFGIARQVGELSTSSGSSPMTLPFASPEQVAGEETTTLSDVYSLGVLLSVLLTGRLPYRHANSVVELRDAIIHDAPMRLSELVQLQASGHEGVSSSYSPPPARSPKELARHLQGDLDSIVSRALSKEPSKRYPSAAALVEDIRKHLAYEPVSARPASRWYRAEKFVRRRAVPLLIAGTVSIALLLLVVALVVQYTRAVRGEQLASVQAERTAQVNRFVVDLLRRTNPFDPNGSPNSSVDELLDQSSRSVESSLNGLPDLKASFLSVLGEIFVARDELTRGRQLLANALALQRGGPRDHALAETLYRYGSLLGREGRYRDSEAALTEAQDILAEAEDQAEPADPVLQSRILIQQAANRLHLGDYDAALSLAEASLALLRDSPANFADLANSFHGLGRLLELKGRVVEAEAVLLQALTHAERIPESRNLHVAVLKNSLGALMQKRGDYAGARSMYVQALAIHREVLGEGSEGYAVTLHNLATLAAAEGQYREALEKFTQVVAILETLFPASHPRLLSTRDQLASALVQLQEYERAEAVFLETLAIERATLPRDHPLLGTTLNNLAVLYQNTGRLSEAEEFYNEALGIFTAIVGSRNNRSVATLLGNLGTVAQGQGDGPRAEDYFSEALTIVRSIDGGRSPDTVNALINLAAVYLDEGDLEQAGGLVNEALHLAESIAGPTGRLTASTYALEARLFLVQGDFQRALFRARQARDIFLEHLPPDDWRIAYTDSTIGAALAQTGNTAEGEELLLRSLSELRRIKGDAWPPTREAAKRVQSFYMRQGRRDEP